MKLGLNNLTPWSNKQRTTLAIVTLVFLAILAALRFAHPFRYNDPPQGDAPHAAKLATKIDPNSAGVAELSALPLIGPARAQQIIDYRDGWQAEHPNEDPFTTPEDLLKVKGIGKSTLETLKPYLIFPAGND